MARKSKNLKTDNLKIAFIFCLLVVILIGVSALFKLALLIRNSSFDGKHNFNVLFHQEDQINNVVISFSPMSSSISILDLTDDKDIKPSAVGKTFEIPIDGIIKVPSKGILENGGMDALIKKAIFERFNTNLTTIDLARLWIFSKTIPGHSMTVKRISSLEISDEEIDKISNSLFNEEEISGEKVSIQIINGTNVFGLGNRLARLITNIGGNVVSVSSIDNLRDSEIVYSKNASSTYTLNRLARILGFKKSESKQTEIADIIIKIGKDSLSEVKF